MIDISGLTQIQSTNTSLGTGGNGNILPKTSAPTHGEKTLLPTDQVVLNNTSTSTAQNPQPSEQSQRIDIFVVRDNVFSLYKLPNGEFFSKVRNLKTGEEKVFPSIDSLSYFEAIRGNRGMFVEKHV